MSQQDIETVYVKIERDWESDGASSMSEAAVHEEKSLIHKVKVKDSQSEPGARVQAGVLMVQEVEVKIESDWESEDACGVNEAAVQEDSSLVHKVNDDDWQRETGARVQADVPLDLVVRDKHDWQSKASSSTSEAAARAGLHSGHLAEDELVLGPESLQPRDMVHTLQASASCHKAEPVIGTQAGSRRACSVRLERMLVDVRRQTCRVGPQTYKFQLCLLSHQEYEASETNSRKIKERTLQMMRQEPKEMPKFSEKPFKCSFCSETFHQECNLKRHLIIHTSKKYYKCGHCSYVSNRESHTLAHERVHTGEKPYKCGHCSYASARKSHLLEHERRHTSEKTYKCRHCSYESIYKFYLKIHERRHTGEKPYKCSYCSYAAFQKSHLHEHERKHIGDKPYKCLLCSYSNVRKAELLIHERKHNGEKPYKCGQCSYASVRKTLLRVHEKKHTDEKPHKCSYCSHVCVRKIDLISHESTHTGKKPYQCNVCDKDCGRPRSLELHMRKHAAPPAGTDERA